MPVRKKKIYLLLPFVPRERAYSSAIGEILDGEPVPLGLYYIAAYLRDRGYEVKVADAMALKLTEAEVLDEIQEFAPSFVGISAMSVMFPSAAAVARAIKERFPHLPIILGGRHVTASFEHAMSCSCFDFAVVGEGEITIFELLDALVRSEPVSDIPGVVYRDEKGNLVHTGERELIHDLDILPFPAFDLIDDISLYRPPVFMYKALPHISMITSRGCPGSCTFCACSMGKTYRKRSAENVASEIRRLVAAYGIREIDFLDDNFLLDKQRIYNLFDLLRRDGINIRWTCMARINSVDHEFLAFLKDSGCWQIAFGIESGDAEILKVIKKGVSLERAAKVVRWCKELGIMSRGFFIIGHPLETLETIDRTINYALSIPLDIIMTSVNTPFPGTQQYEEAERYGSLDTSDLTLYSQYNPIFVPHGLTREILLEKQNEMHVRFYFRPGQLIRLFWLYFGKEGTARLARLTAFIRIFVLRLQMAFGRG